MNVKQLVREMSRKLLYMVCRVRMGIKRRKLRPLKNEENSEKKGKIQNIHGI